jgi:cellulose synthase/poly-beta-1,6-N-acetylglucosamine synthase-like glycosyltransferase
VPACNEAETIEKTIHSLMAQTYPFECVRVIANNCTDDTVEIVQMLQAFYESIGRPELQLLVMAENKGKKSGALNYGLATVEDDIEFVFGMDGDTIVDERMIEEGIIQFSEEPKTGGICSAYRTLPLGEGVSHWKRFLWRLQNIEFTLANAWRVENYKSARVLPGVSVMFRMEALVDVATLGVIIDRLQEEETTMYPRKPFTKKWLRCIKRRAIRELQATKQKKVSLRGMMLGGKIAKVWATNNLVEDYRLTLDLKDIGWQVKSSLDMISWSDVPLRLRGKGGLWDQRQRWYSGTIDELRLRRLKRHSRYEIFTIF